MSILNRLFGGASRSGDLSVAARDGDLTLARSLIARGANVNVSDAGYPLIVAVIAEGR